MLILSNEDIEKILPVAACLEVLEEAYRDLGNGVAATVPRYDVFSPTKPNEFYEYKTMSGVLPNRKIAALRLNSSVVKWYEKAGGVRKISFRLPAAIATLAWSCFLARKPANLWRFSPTAMCRNSVLPVLAALPRAIWRVRTHK